VRNIATIDCIDNPKIAKPWMHFISHSMSVLFDEYKTLSVKSDYYESIYKTSVLILHGCGTGGGKIAPSEGLKSIQKQYIYKGVPTIISSYWDADNLSSSVMFQDLYQNLHAGKSLSSLVRQSKIKIKNSLLHPEWANPTYWANFQITGRDILFID
jgi:CHAT domain-containing protein